MTEHVRIWFSKQGRAVYISHLDLMRCMARAMRLAKIPIWYTEGFNPHPYMTFPAPLSLGISGLNEPLDMRLTGEMSPDEIVNSLNKSLPPDIRITGAAPPVMKAKEIAFAQYEITLASKDGEDAGVRDMLENALSQSRLMVLKRTKSKEIEVDVLPHIKNPAVEERGGRCVLKAVLTLNNAFSLNPVTVADAVAAASGRPVIAEKKVRIMLLNDKAEPFM